MAMTSSSTTAQLLKTYPWTRSPLIANGPMRPFVTADLATQVSLAGGIGFMSWVPKQTSKALDEARTLLGPILSMSRDSLLPIGVGYIIHSCPLDTAREEISTHRPAAAWLFAPAPDSHTEGTLAAWSTMVRSASPKTSIWVQVGSVADAVAAVTACAPSTITLVAQGIDAGGHGLAAGAGLMTLLPEMRDALVDAGHSNVPVFAAGGIVESRAAAAAFALGADGIVIGTRLLCASEAFVPDGFQQSILDADDGGQSTTRSILFDRLRGTKLGGGNGWPLQYDGRGLRNLSTEEEEQGTDFDELQQKFKVMLDQGKPDRFGVQGRDVVFAGTGVGLIKKIMPAREILDEIRTGVVSNLQRASKQYVGEGA